MTKKDNERRPFNKRKYVDNGSLGGSSGSSTSKSSSRNNWKNNKHYKKKRKFEYKNDETIPSTPSLHRQQSHLNPNSQPYFPTPFYNSSMFIHPSNKINPSNFGQQQPQLFYSSSSPTLSSSKSQNIPQPPPSPPLPVPEKYVFTVNPSAEIDIIEEDVVSISDLIRIGMLYKEPDFSSKNYSINVKGIYEMIPALEELNSMIGLENLKRQVVEQIMYFCQNLHSQFQSEEKPLSPSPPDTKNAESVFKAIFGLQTPEKTFLEPKTFNKSQNCLEDDYKYDMFHTVINGGPGVGKTAFARLLSRVYLSLGITKKDTFVVARLSDLKGEYLGQTAKKTMDMINKSLGGVLFIDEAYSIGGGNSADDGKTRYDIYSKELIDTLNQQLTERKGEFILIIAGYKEELEKNFFSLNPGLRSRFAFWYNIEGYTWEELTKIMMFKVEKIGWNIEPTCKEWLLSGFIKNKMEHFKYFARDIEMLLLNVKILHSKRVFGKHTNLQKQINKVDIEKGFERYINFKNQYSNSHKEESRPVPFGMYV